MNTPLETYFGQIVVINMDRRPDRLAFVEAEMEQLGITAWQRFSGIDMGSRGNHGCTASHRGVLDLMIENQWPRMLVLEDDFKCIYEDTQERFESMINEVPDDWWLLYLGGHYADMPQGRVSPHVIRMNRMKTTSSYGITLEAATVIAPTIEGGMPIDELYGCWQENKPSYIFQPRLMVQREGYSDIQQHSMDNGGCMMDTRHEDSL